MSWTSGRFGSDNAIAWDGTGGILVPNSVELPAGGDARHLTAWASVDPTQGAVIIDAGTDGDGSRFILLFGGDGSVNLILGPGQIISTGPGAITDSSWHQVDATYSAGTVELWLDDDSVGTLALTLNTTVGDAFMAQAFDGSDAFPFALQDWTFWPTAGP